ncbi:MULTISPECIES: M4 family metallopeptidase [unclassified Myroides]|uniref:M4 family metallopeptidase n=1 Tax=unclassified Myroides TaxID=2642485 RepID=UPI003D2F6992
MRQNYVRIPILYVALASFLWIGSSYASSMVDDRAVGVEVYKPKLPAYTPVNDYGSFVIRMDQKSNWTEKEFLAQARSFFGMNETNTFQFIHRYTDELGKVHNTYQHFVGQYPVEGQMFIVHSDAKGRVTGVNGTIIPIENKKSTYSLRSNVKKRPIVSKENAVKIALKANQIKRDQAQDYPIETVFVKSTKEEGLFVLAHKIRVEDSSGLRLMSKNVFVDVEDGAIVNEVSLIAHANVRGSGNGFYRPNLPLELTAVNGKYQLVDTERNITTYNAENMTSDWDFYDELGDLIESSTPTFPQSPVNDLHWGLTRTYDYYKERHHRNSFDGKDGEISAYYNPIFLDGDSNSGFPDNAFAMHNIRGNFLVFGRGSGYFNPLVTLDVVGHEFSHLVVGHNGRGGLVYQGESGALNEGFADIFGTSIEHFATDDADWLIGDGIVNFTGYSYMRNMQNPKNNHPASRQPNTYLGENWADTRAGAWDNGGVHVNSGVMNYWYYLLAEGGSGMTDPIFNEQNEVVTPAKDYIVSGIGIQKAEKIAYHTLMSQLGSNSQYADAVAGTLTAATDLFGEDSEEYLAVYDAWYAVGLLETPRENMGIEDFELSEEVFSMYPNPVSNGELTILLKEERGSVAFYTMAGQKATPDFTVEKGENKIHIPQLKTGTYIVFFESNTKKISTKIVVR